MNDVLVILNPVAGGGADGDEVRAWQERRPWVELRTTTGEGDARRWGREAAESGCDMVVGAGGDGTIHEVACGILEAGAGDTALGILPLGTGNDLARSLGIPLDAAEALAVVDRGRHRRMDALRLELDGGDPRFVVNALTGGFSGQIHEALDAELKESWGPLSYLRSGLETWGERSVYALDMSVDGEGARHEALNLVVANGAYAGHGLPVAPGADPFDGRLDVAVILEAPALELSGLAASMLTGEPVEHDALVRTQGRRVEVRSSRPLPVSVDGEPTEASELVLELMAEALPVVVGT